MIQKVKKTSYRVKKEIIFFSLILLFLTNLVFAAEKKLEVTYPKLPGIQAVPVSTTTSLPQYLEYVFKWSIYLIGIVILGTIIYNGVKYLLSVGDPEKLKDAKNGIISALFGGIILLGAVIIFNTINPQLLIIEIKPVELTKVLLQPGVYLCNYNVSNIKQILTDYTSNDTDRQNKANEELKKLIPGTPPKLCIGPLGSGNFSRKDFSVPRNNNTWFILPERGKCLDYDFKEQTCKQYDWKYKYGFVLHSDDKRGGSCKIFPGFDGGKFITPDRYSYHADIKFDAHSISVFEKTSPLVDGKVTLYSEPGYSQVVEEGKTAYAHQYTLSSANDIKKIEKGSGGNPDDGHLNALAQNTRSIDIDPNGDYFALLFENEDFDKEEGKCQIVVEDRSNLEAEPIGRCGSTCTVLGQILHPFSTDCHICLQSMYIIKGKIL